MKLEVGKSYKNRKGGKVAIVSQSPGFTYGFLGSNSYWYSIDGKTNVRKDRPSDLISEWEEPKTYTHTVTEAKTSGIEVVNFMTQTDLFIQALRAFEGMTDTERKAALAYLNERWGK